MNTLEQRGKELMLEAAGVLALCKLVDSWDGNLTLDQEHIRYLLLNHRLWAKEDNATWEHNAANWDRLNKSG